jgi:hypothetical protein
VFVVRRVEVGRVEVVCGGVSKTLTGRKHEFLLTNVTQCGQRLSWSHDLITYKYKNSYVFGLLHIYYLIPG